MAGLADRECIALTAGREAKGYWRLSPERRAAVIEAGALTRTGHKKRSRSPPAFSRATVSRIKGGDRRDAHGPRAG